MDIYCKNNKDKCEETTERQTIVPIDCLPSPYGDTPICVQVDTSSCQYAYVCIPPVSLMLSVEPVYVL